MKGFQVSSVVFLGGWISRLSRFPFFFNFFFLDGSGSVSRFSLFGEWVVKGFQPEESCTHCDGQNCGGKRGKKKGGKKSGQQGKGKNKIRRNKKERRDKNKQK